MSENSKIYLFKDRKDYIKEITKDNIVNVIGTKGSGKTTTSLKYINDDDYIVINCDRLLDLPTNKKIEDKELPTIRDMLINKYGKILEGKKFIKCYNDIVCYIKSKNKKGLIEGNIIQEIEPITDLKGLIVVKRTGVIKSYIRAVKRDYKIEYFMKLEIEKHGKLLGKFHRLKNISKRRKSIFKTYHRIEDIINKLEKFN